tara:strand:+ start:449 stop:730 length:282 start_codon:yes stop_codon:yes gene_type:complete
MDNKTEVQIELDEYKAKYENAIAELESVQNYMETHYYDYYRMSTVRENIRRQIKEEIEIKVKTELELELDIYKAKYEKVLERLIKIPLVEYKK